MSFHRGTPIAVVALLGAAPLAGQGAIVFNINGGGYNHLANLNTSGTPTADFKPGYNFGLSVGREFTKYFALHADFTFAHAQARGTSSFAGADIHRLFYGAAPRTALSVCGWTHAVRLRGRWRRHRRPGPQQPGADVHQAGRDARRGHRLRDPTVQLRGLRGGEEPGLQVGSFRLRQDSVGRDVFSGVGLPAHAALVRGSTAWRRRGGGLLRHPVSRHLTATSGTRRLPPAGSC